MRGVLLSRVEAVIRRPVILQKDISVGEAAVEEVWLTSIVVGYSCARRIKSCLVQLATEASIFPRGGESLA